MAGDEAQWKHGTAGVEAQRKSGIAGVGAQWNISLEVYMDKLCLKLSFLGLLSS